MAVTRPFAFNTGSTITGTIQVGNLAIGVDAYDYSEQPGGVRWWNGPDETLGYVIAHETLSGNQPNQLGIPAFLGFWRSEFKTEESFISLAEWVSAKDNDPQTFLTGNDAKTWLNNNGYWTSYVLGDYIMSSGKIISGGNPVGYYIDKDMEGPSDLGYPASGIAGGSNYEITADYWNDWGDDIFDNWGYYYLYDPTQDNYLELSFDVKNQDDGEFSTQVFEFNGREFTIVQGYPVEGIFKFEITVNDDLPFAFGEGGNMGSDGSTVNNNLSYNYTLDSTNLTLWYNENYQMGNEEERFYSYYVPYLIDENGSKTYIEYLEGDDLYLYSIPCSNGITVYHSKGVDVREWVTYDLTIGGVTPTPTPTPTVTAEVTPTPTSTPTPTASLAVTPTPSPQPVTGYSFNLVVLPYNFPSSGNTIMNSDGSATSGTTDPNVLATGSRGIYWNAIDSDGIDRTSYFSGFTGQNITITISQTGSTAIYTGDGNSLKQWVASPTESGFVFGAGIGVPPSGTPSGTATLTQSATTEWNYGVPVYISVTINTPGATPTPTPTPTYTTGSTTGDYALLSTYSPASTNGSITFPNHNAGSATLNPNTVGQPGYAIYLNRYDILNNDMSSTLNNLIGRNGTLTLTQGSNSVTYSFTDTAFGKDGGYMNQYWWDNQMNASPLNTITVLSSAGSDFNIVDPITITVS